MRRTKVLLSCLLALALVMLTACGARQQTVHRLSADRVTQAATVSQLQEVSDLIVVFTPETQENVLSRYSVVIRASKEQYPVLLSNGNRIEEKDLDDGRHEAR